MTTPFARRWIPALRWSLVLLPLPAMVVAQTQSADPAERARTMSAQSERNGLAEPFRGLSTDGAITQGLFPIRSTGVSTGPVRQAASAFLASLSDAQRKKTIFPVDDPEWRKWMNQHFYVRQGVGFGEMSDAQREAAIGLMRASLSARGLQLSRDVMRLNETLAELTNNHVEYGEGLYWLTVMGTPSADEPWGWQLDGHHLIVNFFVLGDQVVMSPSFWGSEPVVARAGRYRGTVIMQDVQDAGLAFVNGLDDGQRKQAIIEAAKPSNNNLTEAFRDNADIKRTGIAASALSPAQRQRLQALIGLYVGNMRDGHAAVKMREVQQHMGATTFSWVGGTAPDSVFYYRIHSPVILIEFDHQRPVAIGNRGGPPTRDHVHAVLRTPNGNDYGADLLRQHLAQHPHPKN